jgi:dolichol-phosphate mannosyltransferase
MEAFRANPPRSARTPIEAVAYPPAMRAVVVTPTFNERPNVERLLPRLRAHGLDVVVVDDGSPDGTGAAVLAMADQLGGIELIQRGGKKGFASAYRDGFRRAVALGADRIVQMDADLSHDPDDVPRLLEEGADLVLGSRCVDGGGTRGWPLHRQALSRFGSLYARVLLGLPQRDLTGGFKAWRADLLRRVIAEPIDAVGYVFQIEMTSRAIRLGATVREVPIVFTERADGVSKMSPAIAWEAARRAPGLRRR